MATREYSFARTAHGVPCAVLRARMPQVRLMLPDVPQWPKILMNQQSSSNLQLLLKRIERREWALWSFAILVTLLLTAAIVSFIFPMLHEHMEEERRVGEECRSRW